MRTNIDDIIDSVLPNQEMDADDYYINGYNCARFKLKQAITEKKLVVPLSEDSINEILSDFFTEGRTITKLGCKAIHVTNVAKAIYQAQFGGVK